MENSSETENLGLSNQFYVGQNVIWHYAPQDGYGYRIAIPGIVVEIGETKVKLEFFTAEGIKTYVWAYHSTIESQLPISVEFSKRGDEIELTEEDEEILDRVWEQIGIEMKLDKRINTSSPRETKKRQPIRVKIQDKVFEGAGVPDLFYQALVYLEENDYLKSIELPVATGQKRFLLSTKPIHPSGKEFFKPVEYKGFYMETNMSHQTAVAQLKKLVESCELKFEEVVDNSSSNDNTSTEPLSNKFSVIEVKQVNDIDRYRGSLIGLAVGDALGTTIEFKPTGAFVPVITITGGGVFNLNAGEWTDDTSMALCLADSLIERRKFDAVDQMQRYCRWKNEGYLSSNGRAFDIGTTIRKALEQFENQGEPLNPFCGSLSPSSAGNGSLMRLSPVILFFAQNPTEAISYAAESSRTTHGARETIDACRYFAALIIGVLQGKSKQELLSEMFSPIPGLWEREPLAPKIEEIARGSFKNENPPSISGFNQGYVVHSLQIALWGFHHCADFRTGALKVVNLGYDADTYGAIYGQIAGAFYGETGIPEEWREVLTQYELIRSFADQLFQLKTDFS